MAKRRAANDRGRMLRSLVRRQFDRFRFTGADALAARVPDSELVPPAVQAKIHERTSSRWYPVKGGYLVKWRHDGSGVPSGDFWVEAGGWNHEHCDACNRNIPVGGTCWLTPRGSFYQLCPYCYRRVVQLGRA